MRNLEEITYQFFQALEKNANEQIKIIVNYLAINEEEDDKDNTGISKLQSQIVKSELYEMLENHVYNLPKPVKWAWIDKVVEHLDWVKAFELPKPQHEALKLTNQDGTEWLNICCLLDAKNQLSYTYHRFKAKESNLLNASVKRSPFLPGIFCNMGLSVDEFGVKYFLFVYGLFEELHKHQRIMVMQSKIITSSTNNSYDGDKAGRLTLRLAWVMFILFILNLLTFIYDQFFK